MLPAFAFSLALRAGMEARKDALLSFDATAARRAFPDDGLTPLEDAAWQAWVRPVVARTLAKYPTPSLIARLDGAYVVWLLWYEQTYSGGMNDPAKRRIVVALGPGAVNDAWLERALHHEFAHALQDRRGSHFPFKAWQRANAPGFRYADGGFSALKTGKVSEAFDAALNEKGILGEYGASGAGEDWATFAEEIMVDNPAFWALTKRYPRVREKARLAVDFYRKAFPGIHLRDVAP